ncbi:sulfite exporter TauE/SafE family protein [Chitinophaga pendula]|uniref:sulfite exporter TauE/SafE family protein n=1 Tax=Chitinophaga TaxID=79328 RepID=UPI000BAE7705|nr:MULTISPECIES: sulfite exporter TauE/SafE family protein [Chitinophaga]ASZ14368.1 hypothetical protein CK934_27190 [Chitinophaga sp. MD30]UCJ07982.1 sulfite exporter TauE/SafE family protein [Chitinophaga pendula]
MNIITSLTYLLPGLLLGFLGSFHCVGMCGPIALTLPVIHLSSTRKLAGILLYNAGRTTTYLLLGSLSGWLGQRFFIGGLQQWLSILLGILLLLLLCWQYILQKPLPQIPFFQQHVKSALGRLLTRRRFSTLFTIGFLNGLLPCGLVYIGITGAIATGSAWKGALFMTAFGIGTIPAMAAVSWFSQLLRVHIRRFIPVAIGMVALLLIVRGMNLGIPYISPALKEKKVSCCHK